MKKFPFIKQRDSRDCGPACIAMISKHYGKMLGIQKIRDLCHTSKLGVSLLNLGDAAEKIGLRTLGVYIDIHQLQNDAPLPLIVYWKQSHYIVVYKIKKNTVHVADPAIGLVKYALDEFKAGWLLKKEGGTEKGACLLFEVNSAFFEIEDKEDVKAVSFKYIYNYLKPHKKFILHIFLGMIFASIIQLIFPFLTQSVIDIGINTKNIGFIYLILIAQLVLILSRVSVEYIRSWILLHVSTRISVSLISDFLIKLMRLPIRFFESRLIGDVMQRIGDHGRIQSFLTGPTFAIVFSFINFFIFAFVLCIYNFFIFLIFLIGSAFYIGWVTIFMKRRRVLDYKKFSQMSKNQSALFQIITGMQEIKLNNCEKEKRWSWERIQAKLFKLSIKGMTLMQTQGAGSLLINEIKNTLITIFSAKAVLDGNITLGMMMSIQYIIGQMNGPIEQVISFIHSLQDAKISFERLGEIHTLEDEEPVDGSYIDVLPENRDVAITDLSFRYGGEDSELVLRELNLRIPQNKTTAIVGLSGSGKTTLIKLLLGFYKPTKGEIKVGPYEFQKISRAAWRDKCGVVMQDGFIFSDTIENNIKLKDEPVEVERMAKAVKIANIGDFIESLPLSYRTVIGPEGHGLSQGQKQRILIARAVYKNPEFVFFDEATNSLDAENEKIIMEQLNSFFCGRTAVIVAHRLSTVKGADQIVVLEKGRIAEQGRHEELITLKGSYFRLVKEQLNI